MKKFVFILPMIFTLIIGVFFPFLKHIDAAETNLVLGKDMGMVTLTDGNLKNLDVISANVKYAYTFAKVVDVSTVKLYKYETSGVNVSLTLDDGRVIVKSTSQSGPISLQFDATGVKTITLYSSSRAGIYELEAYGTHPLTDNPEPEKFVIQNVLSSGLTTDSVSLSWNKVDSKYLKSYNVYIDTKLVQSTSVNSYSFTSLTPGKTYHFFMSALDTFGVEYAKTEYAILIPEPDTIPPGVPTKLSVVPDRFSATATWTKPPDKDVVGYYLFLGDQQVNASPIIGESYQVSGLDSLKDYKLSVQAVDTSGNKSPKSSPVSFKTLELKSPPAPVNNLSASSFNGSVLLTWLPSPSATGYRLYENNKLLTTTDATQYRSRNLVNGQSYSYYVIAKNDVGDSVKSSVVIGTPSVGKAPETDLGYTLSPIASSTATWFSSFWMLLAFSISIPLAFYVANRTKGLFLG